MASMLSVKIDTSKLTNNRLPLFMLAIIAVGWTIVYILNQRSRRPSNSTYNKTFNLTFKMGSTNILSQATLY